MFVSGFNGLGLHTLLGIIRMFPNVFKNFVFIQVGVVDAGNFKGAEEMNNLKEYLSKDSLKYTECLKNMGYFSETLTDIGADMIDTMGELSKDAIKQFPNAIFFAGQLVFKNDSFLTRLLHNYVVFALQRKLFREGQAFVILPIRV